jgi:hypothetical protein
MYSNYGLLSISTSKIDTERMGTSFLTTERLHILTAQLRH